MADQTLTNEELPLEPVGARLRRARDEQGLSRADIAGRTRIAERHIAAIEESRFADLASSTYAVGFSRAYARVVGLDERAVAQDVREELARESAREEVTAPAFEPGDPARIPAIGVAWLAAFGAIVAVGLAWFFWPTYYSPAVDLPDLTSEPAAVSTEAPALPPVPASARSGASGPVVLTATQPLVWVRVYDAAGNQLFQKELTQGESYTVPADANGPMIRTARPDALAVTVGGKPVAPLANRQTTISDVPVSAAALLARETARPAAPPPPVPVASRSPEAVAVPSPAASAAAPSPAQSGPAREERREPAASAPPSPAPTPAPTPVNALQGGDAETLGGHVATAQTSTVSD